MKRRSGDDDAFETTAELMAMALPFILAAAALLLGAFLGSRVEKVEILGIVLREKPFDTRGARMAAASAAVLCLIPAVVLAGVWPPGPSPDPSGSPGPSKAEASSTPIATASVSPSPTVEPTVSPTVEPTKPPTQAPPTATPNPVKKWALTRADELAKTNHPLGSPIGTTTLLEDGWAVQGFENGILYRNPDHDVFAIRESIYGRWQEYGIANTPVPGLGYPKKDQEKDPKTGQTWQQFDTGAIECTPDGSCFAVLDPVHDVWRTYATKLKHPTADVVSQAFRGSRGTFEGGTITVDPIRGTAVCGTDGSTIVTTGPITCLASSPPVIF